ncbi:MAG: 3-isopropylmalate dehydratase small subunit [Acidobacteriota bacterium]
MQPFRQHRGTVAPLWRADIDTDQIVPKQFLSAITRAGFARALFHDWRRRPDGTLDPAFPLNDPAYAGATVLVTGANFGCGSSREHAAWAIADAGFRAVLAPSFADIFFANAVSNGILPVRLEEAAIVAERAAAAPGYAVSIDLDTRRVIDGQGLDAAFAIDEASRHRLLHGLDDIARILEHEAAIAAYEAAHH